MKCLSCTIAFTLLGLSLSTASSGWSRPTAASSPPSSTGQLMASEYNPPGRGGGYPGGTRFDQRPWLDDTGEDNRDAADPRQAPLT